MNNNRVVNARVSKKLYEKISSKAKENRVSISNLIRNLVEDTLEIHDDIHEAIDKKIKKYLTEADKEDILGFQEVILARNTICDNCGNVLKNSDTAYVAVLAEGNTKNIFCSTCKSKFSKPAKEESHASTSNS